MAHFAELNENNEVLRVIVVNNAELLDEQGQESEQKGIDFCTNLLGGRWIQTSYNSNFRKNFAGIGFKYDPANDWFQASQPYPSWTLDSNAQWQAPTPRPSDDKLYTWDEDTTTWVEVPAL